MDLEEGEAEEDKKGTRRLRWADAEDKEEGKGAPQSMRKVQDEEEEVRGVDERREAKFDRDLRQLEERRAQKEAAEKEWIDGSDDEQEGQEETAEEREERKVREEERLRNEEKARREQSESKEKARRDEEPPRNWRERRRRARDRGERRRRESRGERRRSDREK